MPTASLTEADVRARDPQGMASHIADWPVQVNRQAQALRERGWPAGLAPPRLLAVGGMGGSAIAADLVAGLVVDRLPYPLLVCRDYRWPAWVGEGSLVLLSSYSGHTEETLSLYDEARERGLARLALTCGGELGRRCDADGVPWVSLPPGLPPRAAVGYSFVSVAFLLEALGDPGEGESAWTEALAILEDTNRRCAPERPEGDNPAKLLARALVGRALVVVAGGGFPAAAARRLKGQLNENAKILAFEQTLPEMNHNEIVGWEALADLHARFGVVFLRDESDHPKVSRRMEVTRELVEAEGATTHVVWSSGSSKLARLLSLVHFGDWLSFYLAVLAGVDPTPIVKIERLKSALAEANDERERSPR